MTNVLAEEAHQRVRSRVTLGARKILPAASITRIVGVSTAVLFGAALNAEIERWRPPEQP
jgi:hypothetical protein